MWENTYSVIPTVIMDDIDLSDSEKVLYGRISSLTNKYGYCFASNAYFAEKMNASERTIRRWLKTLKDKNYINVRVKYKNNTNEVDKRIIELTTFSQLNLSTPWGQI